MAPTGLNVKTLFLSFLRLSFLVGRDITGQFCLVLTRFVPVYWHTFFVQSKKKLTRRLIQNFYRARGEVEPTTRLQAYQYFTRIVKINWVVCSGWFFRGSRLGVKLERFILETVANGASMPGSRLRRPVLEDV